MLAARDSRVDSLPHHLAAAVAVSIAGRGRHGSVSISPGGNTVARTIAGLAASGGGLSHLKGDSGMHSLECSPPWPSHW